MVMSIGWRDVFVKGSGGHAARLGTFTGPGR
jgi:hypothetical protein